MVAERFDGDRPAASPLRGPALDIRGLIHVHRSGSGSALTSVAALRGLDLRLDPGEVLAVVGPSGSGKSTLLRLVAGLDRPTAGSLVAFGLPLEVASPARLARYRTEDVAIVEQHYWRAISPYLPAREAIAQPLALRGVPARERRSRAQEVLEALGLGDRGDARPIELSGGEQQRIAFGVGLAIRPRLLLADEPTGELDGSTAISLLETVRELVRAEGTSCLIVTHDELVERVADRVVFLHDGRTIAERRGGRTLRVVDTAGWQAPDVPDPPLPPVAAERVADAAAAAAVVFDRVSRTYGAGRRRVAAVTDVSATLARGRFHVVTGPSGSGKSTLLRLIAGLDRPTSGRVVTLGEELATLDRAALARLRASRVGVVGQSARLVPFLSAIENVELGLDLRGSAGPADDRARGRVRARESLAQVGLEGFEDRRPDELSTGERARVAIARALASDPELLLLDEPTAALDRTNARDIATLLDGLDPSRITVIAATHDRLLESVASDRLDLRELAGAS